MGEYNPEDLDGLSEEELAAIQDDDENDTDIGGDDDQGDVDGGDDADGDEDGNGQDADGADAGSDADTDADQGTDDDPDEDGGSEDGSDSQNDAGESADTADKEARAGQPDDSQDDAGDTVDTARSVDDAYREKIKALDERLDEGDIDFEGYKKELLAVDREHMRDMVREETARVSAEDAWRSEQSDFFGDNEYLKENPVVYGAFAGEVNRLLADKAWASKPGPDVLAKAKETIDAAFKLGGTSTSQDNKDGKKTGLSKKQKAIQAAKKAGSTRKTPQTLKDIPASDNNTDGAFDYLDKLDGAAYEAAIAKLSPEEMEAYATA